MVSALRNTVMAVAFFAVASVSVSWDFNSYIACGLALVASLTAGFLVERAFITQSHREMIGLHGQDWRSPEDRRPAREQHSSVATKARATE